MLIQFWMLSCEVHNPSGWKWFSIPQGICYRNPVQIRKAGAGVFQLPVQFSAENMTLWFKMHIFHRPIPYFGIYTQLYFEEYGPSKYCSGGVTKRIFMVLSIEILWFSRTLSTEAMSSSIAHDGLHTCSFYLEEKKICQIEKHIYIYVSF